MEQKTWIFLILGIVAIFLLISFGLPKLGLFSILGQIEHTNTAIVLDNPNFLELSHSAIASDPQEYGTQYTCENNKIQIDINLPFEPSANRVGYPMVAREQVYIENNQIKSRYLGDSQIIINQAGKNFPIYQADASGIEITNLSGTCKYTLQPYIDESNYVIIPPINDAYGTLYYAQVTCHLTGELDCSSHTTIGNIIAYFKIPKNGGICIENSCPEGKQCVNNQCVNEPLICENGENKCQGTDSYTCVNNVWLNKGKIVGKCNVDCLSGNKCQGTNYFTCENYNWINHGNVIGHCGYQTSSECTSGDTKCETTNYFTCINGNWNLQGQINGKCGYVINENNGDSEDQPDYTLYILIGGIGLLFLSILFGKK